MGLWYWFIHFNRIYSPVVSKIYQLSTTQLWQGCSDKVALTSLLWQGCSDKVALTRLLWQGCSDKLLRQVAQTSYSDRLLWPVAQTGCSDKHKGQFHKAYTNYSLNIRSGNTSSQKPWHPNHMQLILVWVGAPCVNHLIYHSALRIVPIFSHYTFSLRPTLIYSNT